MRRTEHEEKADAPRGTIRIAMTFGNGRTRSLVILLVLGLLVGAVIGLLRGDGIGGIVLQALATAVIVGGAALGAFATKRRPA
jgi:uncharacterized membrane protein YccC